MENAEKYAISQYSDDGLKSELEVMVTKESPLTIILNNQELVTLLCSPANLEYLAVGFLFAEGLVQTRSEIKKITLDNQRGVARITTGEGTELAHELLFKRLISSACGRGAAFYTAADAQHPAKIESRITISPKEVFTLVEEFSHYSEVYKATGGVHSAALSDNKRILIFQDDLGRHNAIDKVFGQCIMTDVPAEDHIVITSGRTPSEMILKVAKGRVPILVSIAAPTDLGIRLANDLGVTIIGRVRNKKMNVYTNGWRVAGS
jgi:FdhD protein